MALESSNIGHRTIAKYPNASLWFNKFMNGLASRMGEAHKSKLALTTIPIKEILHCLKNHLGEIENREEIFSLIVFGACAALSFVLSLRGVDVLMLNLSRISKGIDDRTKHLVI